MYRVMVIDDEPLTRNYLKAQIPLLDPHWVVEGEAMDGQEAMEILQTQSFDLRNFFRAAAMDNSAEVKALYPLLYRMKVSLIESEGAIMILALDEDLMLQKSVSLADLSVFKYILYQVATEIIEMDNMGCVSFDEEEYSIILITGEDEEEILLRCRVLHEQVNNVLFQNTGITVTGAVGSCVYDALQLHTSYQKATQVLPSRLVGGGGTMYEWNERSMMLKQIQCIDDALTSVLSGVLENNEIIYTLGTF